MATLYALEGALFLATILSGLTYTRYYLPFLAHDAGGLARRPGIR